MFNGAYIPSEFVIGAIVGVTGVESVMSPALGITLILTAPALLFRNRLNRLTQRRVPGSALR